MRTILSDLTQCGIPAFTFAGFQWPRHVARIQTGTLQQRLQSRKTGCCGEYYHAPKPGTSGRGFYLESDNAAGLRYRYADDVVSMDYSGWYADTNQCNLIRGIVLTLPKSRGFLAGWTMGESMASGVDPEIYADESAAARAADRKAESVADSERENCERFDAMQSAESDADDALETLRDCLKLRHTGRRSTEDVRNAVQELREARATLADATRDYERGY